MKGIVRQELQLSILMYPFTTYISYSYCNTVNFSESQLYSVDIEILGVDFTFVPGGDTQYNAVFFSLLMTLCVLFSPRKLCQSYEVNEMVP